MQHPRKRNGIALHAAKTTPERSPHRQIPTYARAYINFFPDASGESDFQVIVAVYVAIVLMVEEQIPVSFDMP